MSAQERSVNYFYAPMWIRRRVRRAMAHREFIDSAGRIWEAWDVSPSINPRTGTTRAPSLSPSLQLGWIAFRSGSERRRLAPTIPHWESLPDERLGGLLLEAQVVGPTRRDDSG